jgi:hypothetical protein
MKTYGGRIDISQSILTEQDDVAIMLGRYPVRISAGTPDLLTQVFSGLYQSLETNVDTLPRLDHDQPLPNTFQFIADIYYTIRCRII